MRADRFLGSFFYLISFVLFAVGAIAALPRSFYNPFETSYPFFALGVLFYTFVPALISLFIASKIWLVEIVVRSLIIAMGGVGGVVAFFYLLAFMS